MQTSPLLFVGLACIIAAVVAGGFKLVGIEIPPISSVARQALLALVGVAAVVAGVFQGSSEQLFSSDEPSPSPMPRPTFDTLPPTSSAPLHDQPVAHYTFDQGIEVDSLGNNYVVDATGRYRGSILAAPGVDLQPIEHEQGKALRFPGRCTRSLAACPKVVIDIAEVPEFTPGTQDFSYGADVLLRPDEKSDTANVVEKGFGVGGYQWKLQLRDGRPHCVLYRESAPTIRPAKGTTSVADGRWHTIKCIRAGQGLTLLVDGAKQGEVSLPADLDVSSRGSVRIGGKNIKDDDNKQFLGALDNVVYALSRRR